MRLLVIEDDVKLSQFIRDMLEDEHFQVDIAHDGGIGLELAFTGSHAVIVIDWMLPSQDGLSVCRAIRNARISTPILMLTGRAEIRDRVAGLDSGADDYLVKPFALEELLARVRALSRRGISLAGVGGNTMELRCGELVLDLRAHVARYGYNPLSLTTTEWQVLECLMRHADSALSREQIFRQVWTFDSMAHLTMVDVYISYLRRKLKSGQDDDGPIETVRGIGYRLNSHHAVM